MCFSRKITVFIASLLMTVTLVANSKQDVVIQEKFKKLETHDYGVPALDPKLFDMSEEYTVTPVVSNTGKSYLTFNKMGTDTLTSKAMKKSWIINNFLSNCKEFEKPVLDIGAGYGAISLEALNLGVEVIYNDIDVRHLLAGYRKIKENDLLGKLYLNTDVFPQDMKFEKQSLSAVVLHRVIHFLSPNEVEAGLDNIRMWLEPGGKVYIVAMAPQHIAFRDWFLPIYEKRWEDGIVWPGYDLDVAKALPNQALNLPPYLHVMDSRPLTTALQRKGFIIEKADFVSMKKFGSESDRDGLEAFGVVASIPR
ncbi:MAG: class I SAM-dependent methyltransferase [Francisellaceae bacterium]|jgi:SAM-dependent methyltransferase|nr:class I SAM-dependent methyltransferase [Francisellaceae bacterium]MBT6538167.1 class I SAM-dependent methyltransferase [Francisellaceae bacterium]